MSRKTLNWTIIPLAAVPIVFLFLSCAVSKYERGYESADAEVDRTSSSTAKPYFLRDDPPGAGYGRAAIYSYAHNAKGQRFALEPGENRGVFQTSLGSIISITLGVHISPGAQLYSFIAIVDLTDRDKLEAWRYETSSRGSHTLNRASGSPLELSITGGPSGTRIQIVADGEAMRVSLDDLYHWRKMKVQDWRTKHVEISAEEYAVSGAWVENDNVSYAAGNAFYKVSTLLQENDRLEPTYAVVYVAGRNERVADRIPIGNSGYESVWDPIDGVYKIRGFGAESRSSDDSWVADQVYSSTKAGVVKVESGGIGTGFVVSASKGLVLTNNHVAVEDNVQVTFVDGFQTSGRVIDRDPSRDLALIRVERQPSNRQELFFATSDASVGQEVILIGHPAGLGWTLSAARIAAYRSDANGRWLQLDGAVNPGNSGGPVLDKKGAVIGVVFARAERSGERALQNIGMAVPAKMAQEFVNRQR